MTQREQAYNAIRRAVLEGQVPIGETLSERKFTDTYLASEDLGRTPIREALAVLALRGLVRQLPQVGFDVPPVTPAEAKRIVHVRHAMERVIVEQLPADLAGSGVGGAVDRMKRAAKDEMPFEFMTATRDLHIEICVRADYGAEAQNVGAFYDRLQLFFCTAGRQLVFGEMEKLADLYDRFSVHIFASDIHSALGVFDETARVELAIVEEREESVEAREETQALATAVAVA